MLYETDIHAQSYTSEHNLFVDLLIIPYPYTHVILTADWSWIGLPKDIFPRYNKRCYRKKIRYNESP